MTDLSRSPGGSRRTPLRRSLLLATVLLVGLGLAPGTAAAGLTATVAARTWAPAATATIHPGVQTDSTSGQCTANFIFTSGTDVFIGQAAHCTGTDGPVNADGCESGSLPIGTPVTVEGATRPGTLAYNSWLAMQARNEADSDACLFNDFALVRLDPADHGRVNPSVPYWGGPTGLATTTQVFEKVYSYGNSGLRFGLSPLSPKEGYSLGPFADGWSHDVYTVTPGVPGDSGSGFLGADGKAFGVLSTLAVLPYPASNQVTDLSRSLDYAQRFGGLPDLTLALGTEAFVPGLLP